MVLPKLKKKKSLVKALHVRARYKDRTMVWFECKTPH